MKKKLLANQHKNSMSEETIEDVVTPAEAEVTPDIIEENEAVILNKKIAAVAGSYFRALGSITDEEIFALAYTEEGKNSPRLLEIVNDAFTSMLTVGGDIPCGHFNHYKKLVSDFNNTLVFNIDAKLDTNRDLLVVKATGKTDKPERLSHQDIIDALQK